MGRWLERRPDWLGNNNSKDNNSFAKPQDDYGVIYIPLRCPRCKSKKVKCYGSHPPIRYHHCKKCGYNFKSVEQG